MSRALGLLFFVFAALGSAACSDDGRACYPGDYRYCACASGNGYQQCKEDGSAYDACDCSGDIPGLTTSASAGGSAGAGGSGGSSAAGGTSGAGAGGMSSGGGGSGGGKLPFMSPCTVDDDCESGNCHPFNAKGPHCTITCAVDTDCPPPSPGCNPMGVCKAP